MRWLPSLAAASLGLGILALLAALVPYVPAFAGLVVHVPGPGFAGYVAVGLGLVAAASVLLALGPGGRGARAHVLVAAAAPLAAGALVAAWTAEALLTPGLAAPELARLVLVATLPAALLAAVVASVVLGQEEAPGGIGLSTRAEAVALGALLGWFAVVVGIGIAQGSPFSWDEAVYALTSRHWVHDTPSSGWGPHRPLALSALGVVPVLIGSEEWLFRAVALVLGVGTVAATWFCGRLLAGPLAGILAAAAVAAAPSVARDAGLFLNDVPAAGLLVLLVALTWRAMERPGPLGPGLLWLGPVAAAAFYVRYASIIPLGAIAIAVLLAWPGRVRTGWRWIAAAAGVFALLLLPHLVFATLQTGSPLGIAFAAQSNAAPAYVGEALLEYLDLLPAQLVGVVPAALVVIGLAGAVHRWARAAQTRRWDAGVRAITLLVVPALVQATVLGLLVLPQDRYIFFAVLLLAIAGSVVTVGVLRRRGSAGQLAAGGLVGALVVSLALNASVVTDAARFRLAAAGWEREMGRSIGALAGEGCGVLASDVPQITWYSGCEAVNFGDRSAADRHRLLAGDERYLVVRSDGVFQPDDEVVAEYLALVDPQPLAVFRSQLGGMTATLYRFR